ncbi:MAG: ABC transporter permease [Actinobacteria bacterium]|nr:ABC transporter permease [Actinomycetota bacterium]
MALLGGFQDGSFPLAILTSMRRIAEGYGLSLIIGIPLGMLLGRVKILKETVGSIVLGLQALPSICWLPLAVLWFGLSERAIAFVVVMGALLSITIATEDGVRNTPPLLLRAARTLGSNGIRTYLDVVFPAALPSIVTGMKLGWSFAWRSLMAGELLFVSLGLGHLLEVGRQLNDMAQVIAVMIVIIALGLFVDRAVFNVLETRIRRRWGIESA